MNKAQAFQTAGRRFCEQEHARWLQKYLELQRQGSWQVKAASSSNWDYSAEAYALFPRYRFAEKALIEIESVSISQNDSMDDIRKALQPAGQRAHDALAKEFTNVTALQALDRAQEDYANFLNGLSLEALDQVEALPHRRVLSHLESESLWSELRSKWQIRGAGFGWLPLTDDVPPKGVLTFHEELWKRRNGDELLQDFLFANSIQECFVLRELGPPDYEMEISLVAGVYDGSESFLMTQEGNWVLYVSHESSLTLTGVLADFFRSKWNDADQLGYKGPFHTDDLRGTWKWKT